MSKTLDKPGIENLLETEKEGRKKFEQKYKDILLSAPISDADRIQYFAGIMLIFLPSIFHGEWQNRYEAYMDFSEFYLSEFDVAYYNYRSANQKHEKEYPFRFPSLEADTLENKLHNCLTQLSSLFPEKNENDITEIMWQACQLFELYHNIDELFIEENHKNQK